ncbi:DEAD/DEAH box helicase [Streptomyces griseoincarnatus]
MGVDWDVTSEWAKFAGKLVCRLSNVHDALVVDARTAEDDETRQRKEADLTRALRRLGEKCRSDNLWESLDLYNPEPDRDEAVGRAFAELYRDVAAKCWNRYSGLRDISSDNHPARLAFYLAHRSTDPNYDNKSSHNDHCDRTMGVYFAEVTTPHNLHKYVKQSALKEGEIPHPGIREELKAFSRMFSRGFVDRVIADGLTRSLDTDARGPSSEAERLFYPLAPPRLAKLFSEGMGEDLNPMQKWVLENLRKVVEQRAAMLVTAPTGTGKSRIGRAVLAFGAHHAGSSAVQILPLKALVAQEFADWEGLLEQAQLNWQVLAASRDFPQFDGLVARGRFKISLAIYESIGGYLAAGCRPLRRARVVLVDELQYLADRERGVKLEILLTFIRLLPEGERPALVGLSATLDPHKEPALRQWLGVNELVSPPCIRLVPVDAYVLSTEPNEAGEYVMLGQTDAHLIGTPTPPNGAQVRAVHGYAEAVSGLTNEVYARLESPEKFAVALVRDLLKEDPTRRILVFASSRNNAHEMAKALNHALDADDPIPSTARPKGSDKNPWITGRFADKDTKKRADVCRKRLHELTKGDPEAENDLNSWLRRGVAAHTARLLPHLRRQVQQEFREKHSLLRVVVATDTLSVGINLPADIVVVTRLTGNVGGGQKAVLNVAEMDNKTGRAGRLGQGTQARGRYYLITPSLDDLWSVPAADGQLASPEGVFTRYVTEANRASTVRSHLCDATDMARLVLAGRPPRQKSSDFERHIKRVIDATLRAAEVQHELVRDDLPAPQDVLKILRANGLLNESRGAVRLSGLGLAVARAGLPVSAAEDIERVARQAARGASELEVLFEAAISPFIRRAVDWVAIPTHRDHQHDLIDKVLSYARPYRLRGGQATECAVGRHEREQRFEPGRALPTGPVRRTSRSRCSAARSGRPRMGSWTAVPGHPRPYADGGGP